MPSLSEPRGLSDALIIARRPVKSPPILGESFGRDECDGIVQPSTGVLLLSSILVEKGRTVTTLGFKTGTTAGTGAANFWMGIWSHDTAGRPEISAAAEVYSVSRTSGSPTLTAVTPATFPNSLVGRLVTGTGMPASGRVVSQTTTTLTLSGNATSGSPTTGNATIGQYAGPRQNIAVTADTTTTVNPAAETEIEKNLTTPWIPPTTGFVFFGLVYANSAGTQPTWISKTKPASVGISTLSHLAHTNAGPHSTPPGAANPLASVTNVLTYAYCYYL